MVIIINLCWQYFRAWMPKMLREQYDYSAARRSRYFSIAYYLAADVGCLTIGFLVKWLTGRGFSVHGARMTTFLVCSLLTASSMLAAVPARLVAVPGHLARRSGSARSASSPSTTPSPRNCRRSRMGKVTGALSFLTWTVDALVQEPIGRWIDRTHSYSAGHVPGRPDADDRIPGCSCLLWNAPRSVKPAQKMIEPDI